MPRVIAALTHTCPSNHVFERALANETWLGAHSAEIVSEGYALAASARGRG